jgi:hypothetical protein
VLIACTLPGPLAGTCPQPGPNGWPATAALVDDAVDDAADDAADDAVDEARDDVLLVAVDESDPPELHAASGSTSPAAVSRAPRVRRLRVTGWCSLSEGWSPQVRESSPARHAVTARS